MRETPDSACHGLVDPVTGGGPDQRESARAVGGAPVLSVRDLTVRFGGIVALDGVSFEMAAGQIVGLIGPNGAGKTTLFNCLSRLYTPERGALEFETHRLDDTAPHRIPALGISRTFQNLALFPSLSVLQNVMVGVHCRSRASFVSSALRLPAVRDEERRIRSIAEELVTYFGLGAVAHLGFELDAVLHVHHAARFGDHRFLGVELYLDILEVIAKNLIINFVCSRHSFVRDSITNPVS